MMSPGESLLLTCLQDAWLQPFLKVEADALLDAGYQDLGWREVSSEACGLPNPKHHNILVATEQRGLLIDSCLFSTVRLPCYLIV
jgi:hypothetical protein